MTFTCCSGNRCGAVTIASREWAGNRVVVGFSAVGFQKRRASDAMRSGATWGAAWPSPARCSIVTFRMCHRAMLAMRVKRGFEFALLGVAHAAVELPRFAGDPFGAAAGVRLDIGRLDHTLPGPTSEQLCDVVGELPVGSDDDGHASKLDTGEFQVLERCPEHDAAGGVTAGGFMGCLHDANSRAAVWSRPLPKPPICM